MIQRRRYSLRHRRRQSFGFTMLETIIILAVVGLLAALTAPSFNALFASIKVDQAVTELQTTLSSTQRAAIRNQTPCVASLLVQNISSTTNIPEFQSGIINGCEPSAETNLPDSISVVSNVIPSKNQTSLVPTQKADSSEDTSDSWWDKAADWVCDNWGWCKSDSPAGLEAQVVDVIYGTQGAVSYDIQSEQAIPVDSSGKFVVFVSSRPKGKQKCVAISQRMGLTRVGNYKGDLSPTDITDSGLCTSKGWKEQ